MAIDYDQLMARALPDVVHSYTWRDTVLYALGLGLGSDPLAPAELRFVYEQGLAAMPTMAVALAQPDFWLDDPAAGLDCRRVVHGEQTLEILAPLPVEGTLLARSAIDEIIDKGPGRGALLRVRRDLFDQASGALQSRQLMTMVCRGDGGFGGPASGRPQPAVVIPARPPDHSLRRATAPQAALLYRLSGDYNPLHADPAIARAAGFARPIYHGLGTYGIACHALLTACANGAAGSLRALAGRFTAPVFPGETLRTDIWIEPATVLFRCTVIERDTVVLDRGQARFAAP